MRQARHRHNVIERDSGFFQALLQLDTSFLDAFLTDDFVIVDVSSGATATKPQFLDAVGSGVIAFESLETSPREMIVREYDDVAIVIGATTMRFRLSDATVFDGKSRYTHVYLKSGAAWLLASAQGTPIPAVDAAN